MKPTASTEPIAPIPDVRPLLAEAGASPELQAPVVPTTDLRTRLDAFEDVIERLVGDTLFFRARNLERELGFGQIWLKFEGDNPTGTQKDRIAFALVFDALRRGFDTVTVATCGNYGVALAMAAHAAGLQCHIQIPERYHTRRAVEMEAYGAKVTRLPGSYEDVVGQSQALAAANEWYDANPGGANVPVQLMGYAAIAGEIYDQLRDAPAAIAVPMSNGTTLAGIHKGFVSLDRRGKTSRMPRFVGGSAWKKNPITLAFQRGLDAVPELRPEQVRETATNEPLVNWRSLDGDAALAALRHTNGYVADVSDKRMTKMSRVLRDTQGLHVLPASTAGLIALADLHSNTPLPADRYVAVLTGRSP
jgi:threonine synthase